MLWANGVTAMASMGYYPHGGPAGSSLANGATREWGFDAVQRVSAVVHNAACTAADLIMTLGYNPASQIASRTLYNDSYAWLGHYAINRPYTTNGLNQYTATGGPAFAYDANGNLISDGSRTYAYDVENRLISSSNGAALAYDPLGRLFQVTLGSNTTQFLYDGDALVAEYDGAGAMTRRYAHWVGADVPLLSYAGATLNQPSYLHADQQGSIVMVSGQSGNPSINRYDEYGIPASANVGRFQYTGQAWLPEIGMYYYKARIYSPTLGRFLQIDPVGYEGGINLYAYVENDPANEEDPTGNCPWCKVAISFGVEIAIQYATTGEVDIPQAAINTVTSLVNPLRTFERARDLNRAARAVRTPRASTLRPGPHAREGMPARGPSRNFTSEERREMNRQMAEHGCHTCGERNPGTASGNAIPDHQPANALNPPGGPQRIYPHCDMCRRRQAGEVTREVMRRRRENAR